MDLAYVLSLLLFLALLVFSVWMLWTER